MEEKVSTGKVVEEVTAWQIVRRLGAAFAIGFFGALGAASGAKLFDAITRKKGELVPIKGGKNAVI